MSKQDLAAAIESHRRHNAWSQVQLAEIAGVSDRTVQRVERDGTCSHETLLALANAFDIDVSELTLYLSGEPWSPEPGNASGLLVRLRGILRYSLIGLSGLLALVAVAAVIHGLTELEGTPVWIAVRTTGGLFAALVSASIFAYLLRWRENPFGYWVIFGMSLGVLVLGAAGFTWGIHLGLVTGDWEGPVFLLNLLLAGLGALTMVYLWGERSVPPETHTSSRGQGGKMSKQTMVSILAVVSYVVVWLLLMPPLADVSVKLAVLCLTLVTAAYGFLSARWKHRNELLWALLGAIAGFFELGLIVVAIISLIPSRQHATELAGGH